MTCVVTALKLLSGTVSTMELVYTTAFTLKMLVYSAQVSFVATRVSEYSSAQLNLYDSEGNGGRG